MNTRTLVQASVVAALLSLGAAAQATPLGEGDTAMAQPQQVHSVRTFKQAQAASLASVPRASLWKYDEAYGAGPMTQEDSGLDRAAVRKATLQSIHAGEADQSMLN